MKTIFTTLFIILFACGMGHAQSGKDSNPTVAAASVESKAFVPSAATPETAAEVLDSVYNSLKWDDWNCSFILSEIASDECAGGAGNADGGGFQRYDRGLALPDANPNSSLWDTYYNGIALANHYLEYESEIDWTGQEDIRLQYQAEARFLRAYMHFYLTRLFGKIPALNHTLLPGEEMYNTPVEELYSFIIDDLKFCVQYGISAAYTGSEENWGRATKWAAEAMIGRVYLFYRGYYNDSEINSFTELTARACINDVIQNGNFSLVSEFASLWRVPTYSELGNDTSIAAYAGEINPEVVWSIRYSEVNGYAFGGNRFARMIGPRFTNIDPYGQGWGAITVLPSLWNAYDPPDKRRTATILSWDDEGVVYDWATNGQAQYTGYNSKKYETASVDGTPEPQPDWQLDAFEDYMVIRYADVLLMGAEFHLLNGEVPNALSLINSVRERAFGDASHNYTTVTLDDIFAERKLELASEGIRYFDILRSCKGDFSKLTSMLTNIDDADGGDFSQTTDVVSKDVDGSNFIATKGLFQTPYEISDVSIKEDQDISLHYLVYPNPIADLLILKVNDSKYSTLKFQLYDISGKLIEDKQVSEKETRLDMSRYVQGIYILKITEYAKEVKTFKIIKN
jgi:starch-binding outer membrane protein, SusD/RagB family